MMSADQTEGRILSVPVPGSLDAFLQQRIVDRGFKTVSEYMRALIREDRDRAAREALEAKLLEAVERGDYRDADDAFWANLRSLADARLDHPPRA